MKYERPEICAQSTALTVIRGSVMKGLNQPDSQSPPDIATTSAYEADE